MLIFSPKLLELVLKYVYIMHSEAKLVWVANILKVLLISCDYLNIWILKKGELQGIGNMFPSNWISEIHLCGQLFSTWLL